MTTPDQTRCGTTTTPVKATDRCPVCTCSFTPKGRQTYCASACRKTAFRRRRSNLTPSASRPGPHAATSWPRCRGATALVQAGAAGTFISAHEAFWAAARTAHGDSAGTRALVEVLLLHRHHSHADIVASITAALPVGAVSPDVVAVETRKHAQQHTNPAATDLVVVELDRRLAVVTISSHSTCDRSRRPSPTTACAPETGTHDQAAAVLRGGRPASYPRQ